MTAAVDHEDDLRELGVSRDLVTISALRTTLDVVPAGVPRLQARAIDSRQGDTPLADSVVQRPLEHSVEHPARRRGRQESLGGLLEGAALSSARSGWPGRGGRRNARPDPGSRGARTL